MKYYVAPACIFLIIFIINFSGIGQNAATLVKVCLIETRQDETTDPEVQAAIAFLEKQGQIEYASLQEGEINAPALEGYDLVWIHSSDSAYKGYSAAFNTAIKDYLKKGGKVLLTLEAARFINDFGADDINPEIRNKKAEDSGYGRKLGLHAFRSHPVFKGLNGGSYIFKPERDATIRIIGYFDDRVTRNGKVVAIDWDYIFLHENTKLMTEWQVGNGKLLSVGAYTVLSQPNKNRMHLELFLSNCFQYLAGLQFDIKARYWQYGQQKVLEANPMDIEPVTIGTSFWAGRDKSDFLKRDTSENQFWDLAGKSILVMGKENAGIDEIWAHPFMALHDYETELLVKDSIIRLKELTPTIEVRNSSLTRIYQLGGIYLREIISASEDEAACVVHYEYLGSKNISLFIKFRSNLRLMWPYSGKVIKTMQYAYDQNLNGLLINTTDEEFNCLVGSNFKPVDVKAGQYSDFKISPGVRKFDFPVITPVPSSNFETGGCFQFALHDGTNFDVVISANSEDLANCLKSYRDIVENIEGYLIDHSIDDPSLEMLSIISPDPLFNEGYQWALRGTDRFFVNTPGLGASLVAGYGTTENGWDGGHKINGRPGYAWYFGRDGEWSGFALLDYGDFKKVKAILKMYQQYQDLSGKIYHEVSTSGVVHYDASDATPLYIILAGKYLRHSGDLAFIDSSWNHIRKAIDFCFSTDTDGDHLIENTNVGHGWVEGGGLFGSHSSLYLTSCWAEALKEAAQMAKALGLDSSDFYMHESEIVTTIINRDFWNAETKYLSHGKYKNGTFFSEPSIMPAVAMNFKQVDRKKAELMLPIFATDDFSSDWGCRIIGKSSKLYNPRGYHTGSVWPLYTGWIALAEYKNGHSVQGFTHLMNNLQVYQYWTLGFIEEVLHGEIYRPSGVCHHQCWSETMVLQPVIEGMLGFEPNAFENSLKLSPAFPASWDSIKIERMIVGSQVLNMSMHRYIGVVEYRFTHQGDQPVRLEFNPVFEPGTILQEITARGPFETKRLNTKVPVKIYIDAEVVLKYKLTGGISIIPPVFEPLPGDTSCGIRILNHFIEGNTYTVNTEAISNKDYFVKIFVRQQEIAKVENSEITDITGNYITLSLPAVSDDPEYSKHNIKIHLKEIDEK